MILTRDSIAGGIVQEMVARSGISVLSDAELAASRAATLAAGPAGDVWLFGYGSLIWNPAFDFAERRIGRIFGYHRRFCLWTHAGRGTPERPGLMLGLDRGGGCRGVLFRVPESEVETELAIVWRREMVNAAYVPRWLAVRTDDGRPLRAIAFVINRRHERYCGALPDARIARVIATAHGRLGPCADYLFNTVGHLEELGIHDRRLTRLRDMVRAQGATPPDPLVETLG